MVTAESCASTYNFIAVLADTIAALAPVTQLCVVDICSSAYDFRAVLAVTMAELLPVILLSKLPNQVTITPLKLALLPNAVPISIKVSSAVEAPPVNVVNRVST